MVTAGDFRNGMTFEEDGNVMQVIEFQHVKPGKGAAFVRTKIRNVIGGAVFERTFNPTDKFENALNDLVKKYNYVAEPYQIKPIIGEYDNPSQQVQGLLKLDMMLGHSIIYGISGSGKENLLYTLNSSYDLIIQPTFLIFLII